jgi:hypothetical protein
MAGIPQNFQAISNVLANYDFIDIVAGTGIINFYAGTTVDLKMLSNNEFYSEAVATESAQIGDTVAWTLLLDIDFDVVLNRPLVLKGKTVVNVPLKIRSGLNTVNVYAIVKVRKWDGVTETEIVSNDSSSSSQAAAGSSYFMKAVDVDIPITNFKIGETLRLTILGYGQTSASGWGFISIGHDPMNRSTGWDTTGAVPSKLVFQCPVRLNL